jgi:uncharacterized membrane protein YphA (DoxX/SURF4 family)
LRATLGITAIAKGALYFYETSGSLVWTVFIAGIPLICGISILPGFLIPVTGILLFLYGLITFCFLFTNSFQTIFFPEIYLIILSAAIVLLGPGAFSLDARLFGRREIFIPKN